MKKLITVLSILFSLAANSQSACDVPPRYDSNSGVDRWAMECFTGKYDTVKGFVYKQIRYCIGQSFTAPPINKYSYKWVKWMEYSSHDTANIYSQSRIDFIFRVDSYGKYYFNDKLINALIDSMQARGFIRIDTSYIKKRATYSGVNANP